MDLSKCFDRLDHEIIIRCVRKRVVDSSILELISQFLKSGVTVGHEWQSSEIGSPQDGVISLLLANIYLDEFDQEMKQRCHRIVRYADDILIFCSSKRAAENALNSATKILEKDLKLTVNQEKTHIAHSDQGAGFLGVEIGSRYTRIQEKKLSRFKREIKRLTRRNGGKALLEVIRQLNPKLRGFANYFSIAHCSRELKRLSSWIRRRLRAVQLRLWKKAMDCIDG